MRNLLLLIATMIPLLGRTQNSPNTIPEINGVKVEGRTAVFVNKMKLKGFRIDKELQEVVIMKGKVGPDNVELAIFSTKDDFVYRACYVFAEESRWSTLKSKFNSLKETLIEKYGNPDKSRGEFDDPYYEGDGYEMSAVSMDKCNYSSAWYKQNIVLLILKSKQVVIYYTNTENERKKEEDDKNTLKNGL